jgi:hypothetical protein
MIAEQYMEARLTLGLNVGESHSSSALMYQIPQTSDIGDIIQILLAIEDVRAGFGIEDELLGYILSGQRKGFTELLNCFRRCESTNPRDKVYSILGLTPELESVTSFKQPNILPDYRKTVADVYLEAAWFQLRTQRNLTVLSYVQDQSESKQLNFPSWAPDYSVRCTPNPLISMLLGEPPEMSHPWSASSGLAWSCPILFGTRPGSGRKTS